MKNSKLLVFGLAFIFFLSPAAIVPSANAQSSQKKLNAIVVPMAMEGESICDVLNKNIPQREAIEVLTAELRANGFNVTDFIPISRIVKSKGGCNGTNEEILNKIIQTSKSQVYFTAEPNFVKTSTGNYVSLSVTAFNAATHDMMSYQSAQSNKFYSENVKLLSKRAFNSLKEPLLADINAGASLLADIGGGGEVKNNVGPAEIKLESDVDVNIPSLNRVNKDAVAVIIGNRTYDSEIPSVDFALNDARTMKKYLIQTFGFREGNIIVEEDATQGNFQAIFGKEGDHKAKLYNYVKPGKSDVFVFYSGHGAPDPETKDGYFVPVDCDPSLVKFNGYSLNTFYQNLGQIEYKTLNVVIDACFSGSSDQGMLLKDISPVFIKSENTVLNDENAAVFTSCAPDQVSSWYRDKSHGLFTYFFLKGLQGDADNNSDRQLTVDELRTYLQDNVTYMARRLNNREQDPQITGESDKVILAY
ncbi:DUF6175 family protein [Flammeovirgaceae bacterium SG7u.111]|nr:DUF6175 family protein [Flammeovirgaceae bacterium SG7u.132]WPO37343.1 DUF6175 family protein [Flammeovirgaceae bacterium SG7u.111]